MMSHRSVGLDVKYTHHHFCLIKITISAAIASSPSRPNTNRKVIIYTSARSKVKSTSEHLGKFLDTTQALHIIDIITLVSTMGKEEKEFYTNMFLSDKEYKKYNPHIMCATSGVGNAGIDSSKISVVFRLGMPESISDNWNSCGAFWMLRGLMNKV